jgi:ribonucleoside-triphosphate reductase
MTKNELFNELSEAQVQSKVDYIEHYLEADNSADGSLVDPNSNVSNKDIGVLEAELYKYETIQINRKMVSDELRKKYGDKIAEQYITDIKQRLIYVHDETSIKPYCASVSLYPYLFEGTKNMGGVSKAPKNLQSFCGSFVNLVYQLASGFAGAIATVEFLMYFDYFARKTYGADYLSTHEKEIAQELQGVVYALNQPASARGNQSVFWNISVFDRYYFESLFSGFVFPDGSAPDVESLMKLQDFFMTWQRLERKKELLTYPVLTCAMLTDEKTQKPKDANFATKVATQMSLGLSFFIYQSESADSLASCCRLRNELADNTFSYTLGAGGVSTGSIQVITLNMNRIVQWNVDLERLVNRVHMYLSAHRDIIKRYIENGILPAYSAGYIHLEKQFLTIGINGMLEACEYLGLSPVTNAKQYVAYVRKTLKLLNKLNKHALHVYNCRFNTEFVPAESLGVKNANWDKEAGLVVPRDCYNSYFYPVEDPALDVIDRFKLHGRDTTKYLDGGSACHLNIDNLLSIPQAMRLLELACKYGVNYWTFNCLSTICDSCGYINPNTENHCTKCGEREKIDYATRVIGYLKRVSSYSKERQEEEHRRVYNRTKRKLKSSE